MRSSRSISVAAALPDLPGISRLSVATIKELRAISPVMIVGFLCMFLAALSSRGGPWGGPFNFLTGIVYPLACCGIGALSFGHDFSNRTLPTAMALPIERGRVWRKRFWICFLAMLPMAILQFLMVIGFTLWWAALGRVEWHQPWYYFTYHVGALVLAPVMNGLFLAPWLTLKSRSSLFGTLFSAMIPVFITSLMMQLHANFAYLGSPIAWIIGGILGRRAFMNLEAIEGGGARSSARAATNQRQGFRRRNVMWQLFKKELMLQRTVMLLSVVSAGMILLVDKEYAAPLALSYPPLIIILIGALAGAEERQLGALEWQSLLPIRFRWQWMMKIGVTMAMATVFGVLLPMLTISLRPEGLDQAARNLMSELPLVIAFSIVLVSGSLWVASRCRTVVKAMLVSLGFGAVGAIAWIWMLDRFADHYAQGSISAPGFFGGPLWPAFVALGGLLAFAGMNNHRFAQR